MIKNLAQLKRALIPGAKFEIVQHCRKEHIGEIRQVNITQTNAIYTIVPNDCNHPVSLANNGNGYYLNFEKASHWDFKDGLCSFYSKNRKYADSELVFTFKVLGK